VRTTTPKSLTAAAAAATTLKSSFEWLFRSGRQLISVGKTTGTTMTSGQLISVGKTTETTVISGTIAGKPKAYIYIYIQ